MTHTLFDVDGVLLDSVQCYRRVWMAWAKMRHLDPETVCLQAGGLRSIDTIAAVAPHLDPGNETTVLDEIMKQQIDSIRPFAGAKRLLEALNPRAWAIVTSGNEWSVHYCFRRYGLPLPAVQVYGTSVLAAKPAPDAYELAARRLNAEPARCLVIEDSPAGIAAGKSAHCRVLAVSASFPCQDLREADWCFPSLQDAAPFISSILDK